MSNHHVIAAVSRCVRTFLWEGIKIDETAKSLIKSDMAIKIGPPVTDDPDNRLWIWLYQIRPNLYQSDLPMRHITDVAKPAPLPLDLSYLIVPALPGTNQDGADQVLAARVMQIMAAKAHFSLNQPPDFDEQLRVTLEDRPMQEQILLWRALRSPMRLAIYYQISVVRIDPLEGA